MDLLALSLCLSFVPSASAFTLADTIVNKVWPLHSGWLLYPACFYDAGVHSNRRWRALLIKEKIKNHAKLIQTEVYLELHCQWCFASFVAEQSLCKILLTIFSEYTYAWRDAFLSVPLHPICLFVLHSSKQAAVVQLLFTFPFCSSQSCWCSVRKQVKREGYIICFWESQWMLHLYFWLVVFYCIVKSEEAKYFVIGVENTCAHN